MYKICKEHSRMFFMGARRFSQNVFFLVFGRTVCGASLLFLSLMPFQSAMAHGAEETNTSVAGESFFEQFFIYDTLQVVYAASIAISIIVFLILIRKPTSEKMKIFFFTLLLVPVMGGTIYITGETIGRIIASPTGGPVHWHADFRIFQCGEELDLRDPKGLSNRIGTPILHGHNDFRIHVEGTPLSLEEASLENFFHVIGGELTESVMTVPLNDGSVSMRNGEMCPGTNATGTLQVFLWKTHGWEGARGGENAVAVQEKLSSDFPHYIMSPEEIVPPADCIIFEFGPEKERTTHVCEQYSVAEKRGDIRIER